MLHPNENQSKLLGYQGWVEILMITLVYSKRISVQNNLLHIVLCSPPPAIILCFSLEVGRYFGVAFPLCLILLQTIFNKTQTLYRLYNQSLCMKLALSVSGFSARGPTPSITDGVHRKENFVEIIPVFSTFSKISNNKIFL